MYPTWNSNNYKESTGRGQQRSGPFIDEMEWVLCYPTLPQKVILKTNLVLEAGRTFILYISWWPLI